MKSLWPALRARFAEKHPETTVFRVGDLASVLGLTPNNVNKAISRRASLFPKGIGLDGKGCMREWAYDDALKVAQILLNLCPKAKINLASGLACFAF